MNEKIALLGIVEIISALSCGIAILFVTYKAIKVYGRKSLGIEKPNLAYNIFIAATLFSVGFIVSDVIQPILDSFRILSNTHISKSQLILNFILYGGLYILVAYICSLIVVFLGVFIYKSMTTVDEFKELKDNNIGVAIVLAMVIVTLALMTNDGIALLIESFIPYPDLPVKIH